MSHLTLENRKLISSMITQGKKCIDIANEIGCDPTTIAKEIKKNRIISKEAFITLFGQGTFDKLC